jgi:hypothetical protein
MGCRFRLELVAAGEEPLGRQAPPCLFQLAEVCIGDSRQVDEDGLIALVVMRPVRF